MKEHDLPIFSCLPAHVRQMLGHMQDGQANFLDRLSEIRLRCGHHVCLTLDGQNTPLPLLCTKEALSETLLALCGGSLYAHAESLRQGYLFSCGCRVGVAGRAVWDHGVGSGIAEITSLCIRLPHRVPGAGRVAEQVFRRLGCSAGLLVYSPPGGGKTTLLRELASELSRGSDPRRVALIDSRGELYDDRFSPACQVDVLRGYPLALGIEVATRTLAPQVLICDEIGSMEEAEAILSVQGCGVPLIASAHARNLPELLSRPPIARLVRHHVFSAYIGIFRRADGFFCCVQDADGQMLAEGTEVPQCCE